MSFSLKIEGSIRKETKGSGKEESNDIPIDVEERWSGATMEIALHNTYHRIQTFQKKQHQHRNTNQKHEWINIQSKTKPDIPFSFSFSFPSTLPNSTLARLNNGILNINLLLANGFNPVVVVCPSGGLFSGTNVPYVGAAQRAV